jgi:hypothetical protein
MRNPAICLAAALFAAPAVANSAILTYYDNATPAQDAQNAVVFSSGPYTGIGDSIGLSTAGSASSATVEFYNDASAGTFNVSLLFFNAGSPVGTQIGSGYNLAGVSIGANSELDLNFQLGNLLLPSNLVFILEVSGVTGGADPGVELYSDPTIVGTNTPDTVIVYQGGVFSQESTGPAGSGNPYFDLTLTPEPSTWWLVAGAGLAAAVWRKFRRPAVASGCR